MRKVLVGFLVVAACLLSFYPVAHGYFDVAVGNKLTFTAGGGTSSGGYYYGVLNVHNVSTNGNFQSFCIETNEHISTSPVPYYVGAISNQAVLGGTPPSPSPDPLDAKTAYLYYHFRLGDLNSLTGNAFTYSAAGYTDLQAEIWYLEQETPGYAVGYFTTLLSSVSAAQLAAAAEHVKVINLLNASGQNAQDVLCLVPEPASLLLLGLGLLGMGALARRRS